MSPESVLFLLMTLQCNRKERKVTSLTCYAIEAASKPFFFSGKYRSSQGVIHSYRIVKAACLTCTWLELSVWLSWCEGRVNLGKMHFPSSFCQLWAVHSGVCVLCSQHSSSSGRGAVLSGLGEGLQRQDRGAALQLLPSWTQPLHFCFWLQLPSKSEQGGQLGNQDQQNRWGRRKENFMLWWLIWPSAFWAPLCTVSVFPHYWPEAHVFTMNSHFKREAEERKEGERNHFKEIQHLKL